MITSCYTSPYSVNLTPCELTMPQWKPTTDAQRFRMSTNQQVWSIAIYAYTKGPKVIKITKTIILLYEILKIKIINVNFFYFYFLTKPLAILLGAYSMLKAT